MAKLFKDNTISVKNSKDLKVQMFEVFFGKLKAYQYSDAVAIFREAFPSVHMMFGFIKSKAHNRLAILLQRIESHVMLKKVLTKINTEYPGMDLLTKHDSIAPFKTRAYFGKGSTNSFVIGVLMLDVIEEVTGLRPSGMAKRFPENTREVPS